MTASDPVHRGPDNHADWCHSEHDGWCLDVLLAKIGIQELSDDCPISHEETSAKEAQP